MNPAITLGMYLSTTYYGHLMSSKFIRDGTGTQTSERTGTKKCSIKNQAQVGTSQ